MAKRRLIGTITSVKMHETAVITVSSLKQHPLYGKRYHATKAFAAHNPGNQYKLADVVEIEEHRPISKSKHWLIVGRVGSAESEIDQTVLEPEVAAVVNPEPEVSERTEDEPAPTSEEA